jgi:hypothetical protein
MRWRRAWSRSCSWCRAVIRIAGRAEKRLNSGCAALANRIAGIEHGHLACAAQSQMLPGDIGTSDFVILSLCHAPGPAAEARTVPFETVIRVAEPMRRHAKQRIELGVWRRDDHRLWPHPMASGFEHDDLKRALAL